MNIKILSILCFFLTGCTHVLVVQGVRVNHNGKETMHCVMHVNRDVVTPELANKAVEFCKAIEDSK